ncbi:red chlorophyll catabolite reductase, chloroplastic [Malania oleifera]|uniref:red chlorophyll catabolite reductase, chloroplastic n=1 Tax=Malania oleifera TaxID=397392 RepID=UPI0025ADFCD6|nr:red chlorophyll catabolite reductase, chloroplastic [Malania oleifera]
MAVVVRPCLSSPFSFPPSPSSLSLRLSTTRRTLPPLTFRSSCSSSSASSNMEDSQHGERPSLKDFPYVSALHRDLMVDLVSTVETRLHTHLLPCTLPPDVQYYHNQTGTARASLQIRSGHQSSPINFILGSWLHAELPSGGVLDITTLSAYLNSSTDAPHFVIELCRRSPTSLIFILDLPSRKDLLLHPDYLHDFYEATELDRHRQKLLQNVPEVQPYFSSSLYIRCSFSPTAILVSVDTEADGAERMEEIIRDNVRPIAVEVLGIWLDQCTGAGREVGEMDTANLEKRDRLVRKKTAENDLGSNLPSLFGPEVAGRVLEAIRKVFDA